MKKTEKKALKVKLLGDFRKAIKRNRAYLSAKMERVLENSVDKIVKKTSKKMNGTLKAALEAKKVVSPSHRRLAGEAGINPSKQAA